MTNWEEASQTPGTCFNSCGCFLPDLTRLAILQCGEARPRVFYIKIMLGRVTKALCNKKVPTYAIIRRRIRRDG